MGARGVHGEAGEGHDLEAAGARKRQPGAGVADEFGALLERQQRRLAMMRADGDDDPIEQRRALTDHIQMAEGQRVERAGIERGAGGGGGHGEGIGDFGGGWEGGAARACLSAI